MKGMRCFMKKSIVLICLLLAMICAGAALAESIVYVDNHEVDKNDLMRTNMRNQPGGIVVASYYTGAELTVLPDEPVQAVQPQGEPLPEESQEEGTPEASPELPTDEYIHVSIGGVQGYMARKFVITPEEAAQLYGTGSRFGECRPAEVVLNGLWASHLDMYENRTAMSKVVSMLENHEIIHLVGIVDNWAYVFKMQGEQRVYGYIPVSALTEVADRKVSILHVEDSNKPVLLYEKANTHSKILLTLRSGVSCFSQFGIGGREGVWRKVRIGGISGWINPGKNAELIALAGKNRQAIPYYPQTMQVREDALLYSVAGDRSGAYMTLGEGMRVEVMGIFQQYSYVRTVEGGTGSSESGDYGYIETAKLVESSNGDAIGVVQVDNGNSPAIIRIQPNAATIFGALCPGAVVNLLSYTQTDSVEVAIGDVTGYISKKDVRVYSSQDQINRDLIPQRGTLLADNSMMSGPSENSSVVDAVTKGQKLYMLGKVGDWVYVRNAEKDLSGFLRVNQLSAPMSATHLVAKLNTDKVNMRARASRDSEIISLVRMGEILRVVDYGSSWTGVITPSGRTGYILNDYLDFE